MSLLDSAFSALGAVEEAALSSFRLTAQGKEKEADALAVEAMRRSLNRSPLKGTVVIGEGERDEAPMLYIGEKVGSGEGPELDIALDPLEGTTILAQGGSGAMSVIALAPKGGLFAAPDLYMEKIAVGINGPEDLLDLDSPPKENLKNLAKAKGVQVSDLVAAILNRPRHEELIAKTREAGARVKLIGDGDVAAVLSTALPELGIDIYMGTGGAPEGVLAAAALKTLGGVMRTRLVFRSEKEKTRALKMGVKNLSAQYSIKDMVPRAALFAAAGITSGDLLKGISKTGGFYIVNSILTESSSKTFRRIENYVTPKRADYSASDSGGERSVISKF